MMNEQLCTAMNSGTQVVLPQLATAQIIDVDNQNKKDNAFVLLDRSATEEHLIATIAHEVDHICFGKRYLLESASPIYLYAETESDYYTYYYYLPTEDNDYGEVYYDSNNLSVALGNAGKIAMNGVCLSIGIDGYWYQKNFKIFNLSPGEISESVYLPSVKALLDSRQYTTYNDIYREHEINKYYQIADEYSLVKSTFTVVPQSLILKNANTASGNVLTPKSVYGSGIVIKDDFEFSGLTIGPNGDGNLVILNSYGILSDSIITSGGRVEITGLDANNMTVWGGVMVVDPTANSTRYAWVRDTTINNGGIVYLNRGGNGDNITVNSQGTLFFNSDGTLFDSTVNDGGTLYIKSGYISNLTMNSGAQGHITEGYFYTPLNRDPVSLNIERGGVCTIKSGGMGRNVNIAGNLQILGQLESLGTQTEMDQLNLTLKVEVLEKDNTVALVDGFKYLSQDVTNCTISVHSTMDEGTYLLATDIGAFRPDEISFTVDGKTIEENYEGEYTFKWDMVNNTYNSITIDNSQKYTLGVSDGNLVLTISREIPDEILEKLARDHAYSNHQAGEIIKVGEYRFAVVKVFSNKTGLDVFGLKLVNENNTPLAASILLCRGTENITDWEADFDYSFVGQNQYESAQKAVRDWLSEVSSDDIYLTGHSLGGALAQLFAANYNGPISKVVTFNAPGINCNKQVDADSVHHYIIDGDLVSLAGSGYIAGNSDDSWYTVYPSAGSQNSLYYFKTSHSDTTHTFQKTAESGNIAALSDGNFSYLESYDNFNGRYAMLCLALANYFNPIGSRDSICSRLFYDSKPLVTDLNTANRLTTRSGVENFRSEKTFSNLLGSIIAGLLYSESSITAMGSLIVNSQRLISSENDNGHDIHYLEFSSDGDEIPDLLYDFTDHKFLPIKTVALNTIFTGLGNDKCVATVRMEKEKNKWICFSLPFSYSNFMELKSIMNEAGEQVSLNNYFVVDNKIIVLDDPSAEYSFSFERNASVTATSANYSVFQEFIDARTVSFAIELADIDSSLTPGGKNDTITLDILVNSKHTMQLVLEETTFEGVFSGQVALSDTYTDNSVLCVNRGDVISFSYDDAKNADGQAEIIVKSINVVADKVSVAIDENGMSAKYCTEYEKLDWIDFIIFVQANTLPGDYVIATNADGYAHPVTISACDSTETVILSLGSCVRINSCDYTISCVNGALLLSVALAPRSVAWTSSSVTTNYVAGISCNNFDTAIQFSVSNSAFEFVNLANGSYTYRIRETASEEWNIHNAIEIKNNYYSKKQIAEENGIGDIFFANASDTWTAAFRARHVGSTNDLNGTNETVVINGKNRFADLFAGSDDANILYLTDDANGDALFVDDIYTDLPGSVAEQQSRLARINEIRAGAGDDVIDMTSQRYEYIGDGLTMRGGDGDDTIWANKGDNFLFGDAGNDRLVGASGNDVLVGGSGNDSMHGGGGDDIFTFGADWGIDTVEQLATGSVTLWFLSGTSDKWNAATLTYSDGVNSVKVSGVTEVALKFGDDASGRYQILAAAGAFLGNSTKRVFEDSTEPGILASL